MDNLQIYIDGVLTQAVNVTDELPRAVIMSLFTWRRAEPDDKTDGDLKGWWGDSYPQLPGDKIGSRLWLLAREKMTEATRTRALGYAVEALQWLTADGVAVAVDVQAERIGLDGLALGVMISRGDADKINIRFANVWSFINAV